VLIENPSLSFVEGEASIRACLVRNGDGVTICYRYSGIAFIRLAHEDRKTLSYFLVHEKIFVRRAPHDMERNKEEGKL
jgi:hypothetical protein